MHVPSLSEIQWNTLLAFPSYHLINQSYKHQNLHDVIVYVTATHPSYFQPQILKKARRQPFRTLTFRTPSGSGRNERVAQIFFDSSKICTKL